MVHGSTVHWTIKKKNCLANNIVRDIRNVSKFVSTIIKHNLYHLDYRRLSELKWTDFTRSKFETKLKIYIKSTRYFNVIHFNQIHFQISFKFYQYDPDGPADKIWKNCITHTYNIFTKFSYDKCPNIFVLQSVYENISNFLFHVQSFKNRLMLLCSKISETLYSKINSAQTCTFAFPLSMHSIVEIFYSLIEVERKLVLRKRKVLRTRAKEATIS